MMVNKECTLDKLENHIAAHDIVCASFTLNANWVEVPLNQLSDRFKRLSARVQSNYFLAE